MITLDLNKALHPHLFDFVLGLIPGLFFILSFLSGNPDVADSVFRSDHYYTMLFIACFSALVMGCAFLLWVRLIQMAIAYGHWQVAKRLPEFRARRAQAKYFEILEEMQQQTQTKPEDAKMAPPPQPSKALSKLQRKEMAQSSLNELRNKLQIATARTAAVLLDRYGICIKPDSEYWHFNSYAWMMVLGEARRQDRLGHPLPVSLHATGWGGLAAAYLAPALRTPSFVGFSLFLIGFGLLHDYRLAGRFYDPVSGWMLKLRRTLDELKSVDEKPDESRHKDTPPAEKS